MRSHIDWVTFTMGMRYEDETSDAYSNAVENAFVGTFGRLLVQRAFGGSWEKKERSRAPYMDAWQIGSGFISLFASPTLSHCCVEISGQGCERLIEQNLLGEILAIISERVTRIDIACDIETSIKPTKFVEMVDHKRMRASGFQKSESGETCYVGSQKSDRYARVYRYFEPHPRAHLLRVEHVFRREGAKVVAQACIDAGIDSVAEAAGRAFGWSHPAWDTKATQAVDISVVAAERHAGKTIFWLVHSVAPAIQRLIADGTIRDPEKFIRDYFLPQE